MSYSTYKKHGMLINNQLSKITNQTKLKTSELLILITYPFTVLIGQLVTVSTYLDREDVKIENYFMNKHNFINQIFVKRGWFWTLVILAYFNIQYYHKKKDIRQTILRVVVSTVWWYIFTQSFFGIPIMDRVFLSTGGLCLHDFDESKLSLTSTVLETELVNAGSYVCRKKKGKWVGGHDPSGHVFLLVHSSILLWFEVLELELLKELKSFWQRFNENRNVGYRLRLIISDSLAVLISLIVLWWWMLLITSIHFHSFSEKITGLLAGFATVAIYLIPRFIEKRVVPSERKSN